MHATLSYLEEGQDNHVLRSEPATEILEPDTLTVGGGGGISPPACYTHIALSAFMTLAVLPPFPPPLSQTYNA